MLGGEAECGGGVCGVKIANIDFNIKTERNYAVVEKAIKEYISELKNIYKELKDELERNLYIEAIVKKYRGQYGVSAEDLRKRVNTLALKGTPAENRTQPKTSGGQNKKKKESASDQAQKLMLTWLVTYPNGLLPLIQNQVRIR